MTARRVTRAKVDALATLHAEMKEVEARYDAEIERIKALGPAVYEGRIASLAITQHSRDSVDWDSITRRYKIPARAIARATRSKPFLRADVVYKE